MFACNKNKAAPTYPQVSWAITLGLWLRPVRLLLLTLGLYTWDLYFKQAVQFPKPKTKGRQIWPPPQAAKGPATPLHRSHWAYKLTDCATILTFSLFRQQSSITPPSARKGVLRWACLSVRIYVPVRENISGSGTSVYVRSSTLLRTLPRPMVVARVLLRHRAGKCRFLFRFSGQADPRYWQSACRWRES